jgi:ribosome biogenesis GTPase
VTRPETPDSAESSGDLRASAREAGTGRGVVLRGTGGVWVVRTQDGETHEAALRGRLKQSEDTKLAVGDEVIIAPDERGSHWAIEAILPRRSVMARRAPGRAYGERVVAANIDQALIVFAAAKPEPHRRMVDRFLVIAEGNHIAARLVITKIDLVDRAATTATFSDYERAGYPVHFTSTRTREGLEQLHQVLSGRVSTVTGPCGVGKSSVLNALYPGLNLRVGEISESVNKGRHTTVGAYMHPLPDGGYVVDTPGLREVGLWGVPSSELDACFPEFRPFIGTCRFADCSHIVEPGCEVRAAVVGGVVSRERYESYVKLRGEAEEEGDAGR